MMPGFEVTGVAERTGEIGTLQRFSSEASLALYLGMVPLDNSSGLSIKGKRPKCVNDRCQTAMMTGIVCHMAGVPESRACHDRKRAQGKIRNQAVRALGRQLVRFIWKMLGEERHYVDRSVQTEAVA